jgi:hypothetical protein
MPRIPDFLLDSTIYLYPTQQDAENGERIGGSGFLVSLPFERHFDNLDRVHVYAVTNSHVVTEGKSTVIRITDTNDRKPVVIAREKKHWHDDYYGADVAVCLMPPGSYFATLTVSFDEFLKNDEIEEYKIGIGTDTISIGRFITHDGKQLNLPVVRFGNIAMMNHEPIEHPQRGTMQETFLVEAHSYSGYSGSIVYASDRHFTDIKVSPRILGIGWGHMHDDQTVVDGNGNYLPEDWKVRANTGMMLVLPAWKINELLNRSEVVEERRNREKELEEKSSETRAAQQRTRDEASSETAE